MSLNLKIINPINYNNWDELLLSTNNYSFFHTSYWARVLHESYGYRPLYFSVIDNGSLRFSLPLMEIKSRLTGRRGVSLPFTDYCEPIINEDIHFQDILDHLIEYGKQAGWKYIEMRSLRNMSENIPPSLEYYGHTLRLSKDEDLIYSQFRSSTQRNIKKATSQGVRVAVFRTLEGVSEFYRLNCLTRKMHGIPPQPWEFFRKTYDHIISGDHGRVILASYKGVTIAGAVYFHFGTKTLFKYGASDKKYQYLRANNLVMWEAIREYCNKGYKTFCFGRTEPENKGLRQFKNGWGASEKIIRYYRYDFKRNHFVNGNPHVSGLHNKLFNKMPIPLLKLVGSKIYKHVG
ncbi:MAG: hypothetical protein IEMM0007_0288 [bacterium]|nr:MAG: hypothetical protein IEMM0007_0288 [bacterium]